MKNVLYIFMETFRLYLKGWILTRIQIQFKYMIFDFKCTVKYRLLLKATKPEYWAGKLKR